MYNMYEYIFSPEVNTNPVSECLNNSFTFNATRPQLSACNHHNK